MARPAPAPAADRFRLAAALLVVAIHTSPLASYSANADFMLTRVVGRLAVPFFFMVSGCFLLARYAGQNPGPAPLLNFLKKTALLYGASVLLYLPVNLYAGHFSGPAPVRQLVQALLVDGTFYHLWYLPAAIFGAVLVWLGLRRLPLCAVTAIAAGLYLIGLLGDSWYGFSAQIPALRGFYDFLFAGMDYTRNGLFFAPLFLVLGEWAARAPRPARRWPALTGLGLTLAAMAAEALLLRAFLPGRHDSMYITLPLCLWFLFRWLQTAGGRAPHWLRPVSLGVYLLHPLMIVLLRGAVKFTGVGAVLIENSLAHYLAVCLLSLAAALVLAGISHWWRHRGGGKKTKSGQRAWATLDADALRHNLLALQALLHNGCQMMPAVKADAYGHGAVTVCRLLRRWGVRAFCVASAAEGVALRKRGIRGNILVLGYTPPQQVNLLRRWHLVQTVVDAEHAAQLAASEKKLRVHVKIDTGMRRLGERSDQMAALTSIWAHPSLRIDGVFTQLCACDSTQPEAVAFTRLQAGRFYETLQALKARRLPCPSPHIQCSYGLINYPELPGAFARAGIALYGVADPALCLGPVPALRPVLSVSTRVALCRQVLPGEPVGYGLDFVAPRRMTLATLPIGYADGVPRALAGGGAVLIAGRRAPIVGRICMDQMMVDVSGIPGLRPGDEVVLLGRSGGEEISALQLAQAAGTIPNEILSRLGGRLERITTRPAKAAWAVRHTALKRRHAPAPPKCTHPATAPFSID